MCVCVSMPVAAVTNGMKRNGAHHPNVQMETFSATQAGKDGSQGRESSDVIDHQGAVLAKKSGATNVALERFYLSQLSCWVVLADSVFAIYLNEHVFHNENVDDHWCWLVKIFSMTAGGLQFLIAIKYLQTT